MFLTIIYFQEVQNCETCNIFQICVFQEEKVAKFERTDEERGPWMKVEKVFFQDLEFDLTLIQVNLSDAGLNCSWTDPVSSGGLRCDFNISQG